VVDDSEVNRRLLLKLLAPLGFDLQEAENGEQAIAQWQAWQPHLIFMDMRMPVMDGYTATHQIRRAEANRSATADSVADSVLGRSKIIAVTASAFEDEKASILAAGCDDVIHKPFRRKWIFDKLVEHLGVQFQYGEAVPTPPLPAAMANAMANRMTDSLSNPMTNPLSHQIHYGMPAPMVDGYTSIPGEFQEIQAELSHAPVAEAIANTDLAALLAVMPPVWLTELHLAASRLNSDKCLRLIQQIPADHATLARVLADLVDNFRFDLLISLTPN
jgi:CheY-like chemotaxis protein